MSRDPRSQALKRNSVKLYFYIYAGLGIRCDAHLLPERLDELLVVANH